MPQPAIKVENLSKLYRVGTRANHADTVRERLTNAVAAPFRHLFGERGTRGEGRVATHRPARSSST